LRGIVGAAKSFLRRYAASNEEKKINRKVRKGKYQCEVDCLAQSRKGCQEQKFRSTKPVLSNVEGSEIRNNNQK